MTKASLPKLGGIPLKAIFASLLAVCLAIIWLAVTYQLDRRKSADLRETRLSTEFQAQAAAENANSLIKRLNEILLDLRTRWDGDARRFGEIVRQRQGYMADVAFQIAIIDQDGWLAFSNLEAPKTRVYLGEREHFRAHVGGGDRLFISKPLLGKVSGKWSIQFTRPIIEGGAFKGVLVVSVSPDIFTAFHQRLGQESTISLVADSGEFMARHPEGLQAMGKKLADLPFLQPDPAQSGSYVRVGKIDGVERIYGFYRLPEYDLTVNVGRSVERALLPYVHYRQMVLMFGAGGSLIVIVLLLMLYRALVTRAVVEQQLQASQAMLRSAVETIGEAFVIYDENDRLAFCNEQYRDYYQTSADLLVPGKTFEEIIRTGAERGQYQAAIGRVDEWVAERLTVHRSGNTDLIQRLDDGLHGLASTSMRSFNETCATFPVSRSWISCPAFCGPWLRQPARCATTPNWVGRSVWIVKRLLSTSEYLSRCICSSVWTFGHVIDSVGSSKHPSCSLLTQACWQPCWN